MRGATDASGPRKPAAADTEYGARLPGTMGIVKGMPRLLALIVLAAACGEASEEAPAQATVRIAVTDKGDWPEFGVLVSLKGDPEAGGREYEKEAKLTSEGEITFEEVPAGPAKTWLTFGSGGVIFRTLAVDVPSGGRLELEIPLPSGATIEGTVTDRERGPLANTMLTISSIRGKYYDVFHTRTDETGFYRLRRVPAGQQSVEILGATWPRARFEIPEAGTHRRDIVLGRRRLAGVVRATDTGAPLHDAMVYLRPHERAIVRTGADGSYRFDDLLPGPATLFAVCKGYDTVQRQLVIAEDGITRIDLELTPR